jgi:uncharacterized RDD family membrane protein YckC
MLDTLERVETPEGIALELQVAGPLPRAVAWAVDFVLRLTALFVASLLLGMIGQTGLGLYLLVLFATFWLYPIVFELLRDGQTPGKRVVGLRVIHANGTPVGALASIVRNLLRTVDMLPMLYATGVVAGLLDRRGRRLGDMVAGTLVVHATPPPPALPMPNAPLVVPELSLRPEEKAALIAFAERAPQLTAERQAELAGLLSRLTGAQGSVAVQRLLGMANGFLGRA